jgi:hypothetical protein
VAAGATIGRAMGNEIGKRVFLTDQPRQLGKRVLGSANARPRGLLRLRKSVGSRRPKSVVVGH